MHGNAARENSRQIDEDFTPCRNEGCSIVAVHPAHDDDEDLKDNGKRLIRVCPKCQGPLIPLRRRRAKCSNNACRWEGSSDPKKIALPPKMRKKQHA